MVEGLRLRTLGFFGGSFSSGEDAGCEGDAVCEVDWAGSREGDRETESRDGGFNASRSCCVGWRPNDSAVACANWRDDVDSSESEGRDMADELDVV